MSIDAALVDEWLPLLSKEFSTSDIFNANETGLFWRMLPDSTMAYHKEQVRGGKQSKERVTVLVGASATGEKLPLLVIGRSKNPRCFLKDHTKLPIMNWSHK